MEDRLVYAKKHKDDDFAHVVMTDEKWFFRTAKNTIEYYRSTSPA